MKIFIQIDCNGYYIGKTINEGDGAIDIQEPIFDIFSEKAKLVNWEWIIKSKILWREEENLFFKNFTL